MEHKIKFYPVGNADCTLIKLSNGKTIIIDCQIKDAFDKDGKQVCYDVKADLLKELKRDSDNHPFVDLYVSTHPHDDHCIGFGDHFYHGKPEDYNDDQNELIIIGELWVTPYALKNDVCDSAADIRKEAKRRRTLYDQDNQYTGEYGNYLRIIGYDKDKEFDNRYGYIPGTLVKEVNGESLSWLEVFIHAPFKEDVEEAKEESDKNAVSIVLQFAFSLRVSLILQRCSLVVMLSIKYGSIFWTIIKMGRNWHGMYFRHRIIALGHSLMTRKIKNMFCSRQKIFFQKER